MEVDCDNVDCVHSKLAATESFEIAERLNFSSGNFVAANAKSVELAFHYGLFFAGWLVAIY